MLGFRCPMLWLKMSIAVTTRHLGVAMPNRVCVESTKQSAINTEGVGSTTVAATVDFENSQSICLGDGGSYPHELPQGGVGDRLPRSSRGRRR